MTGVQAFLLHHRERHGKGSSDNNQMSRLVAGSYPRFDVAHTAAYSLSPSPSGAIRSYLVRQGGIRKHFLATNMSNTPASSPSDVRIKRAYEPASYDDGYRVLVDRIWPRGERKATLAIAEWARDLSPTAELRQWFGHSPERWDGFQARYRDELSTSEQQSRLRALLLASKGQTLTLVYGAKDEEHNHALVLRDTLLHMERKHG